MGRDFKVDLFRENIVLKFVLKKWYKRDEGKMNNHVGIVKMLVVDAVGVDAWSRLSVGRRCQL